MNGTALTTVIRDALLNGDKFLFYEQLASRWLSVPEHMIKPDDIESLLYYLRRARQALEREGVFTILVTAHYAENYRKSEPTDSYEAERSCALHGRRAVGIRLASLRNKRDDLMFIAYNHLNGLTVRGMQTAAVNRIASALKAKRLSRGVARELAIELASTLSNADVKKLLQLKDSAR